MHIVQVIFRRRYVCTYTHMHAIPFDDKRGYGFEKSNGVYERVAGMKEEYEIM